MRIWMFLFCLTALRAQTPKETSWMTFRPFQATIRSQYWSETGRFHVSREDVFARARDGSHVYEGEAENPFDSSVEKNRKYRHILDVPRRRSVMLEPFLQAAIVFPIPNDDDLESSMLDYGGCRNLLNGTWIEVGRSTMFNLDVVQVEVEGQEDSIQTLWVAPELHCFVLKETSVTDGLLRVKRETISLEMKGPKAELFEIPVGYTSMSPLELEKRYEAQFPGQQYFGNAVHVIEFRYQRAVASSKDPD